MGKLLVRSDSGWRDRFRSYRVLIDGQEARRIRPGEVADLDIGPGRQVVQVAIDWKRSASF